MDWPDSEDAWDLGDGRKATAVEHPSSIDELRHAVGRWAAEGQAIYPQGGRQSLDYGGIPRRPGVAIMTTGLKSVIDYPAADMTITVEAGITLDDLQTVLAVENQRLTLECYNPYDATLGGIFATNTCGPRRLGAGRPRDLILGVSFVTADGKVIKGGGRVVKNVAGYDFPKLLTGSMGTLGLITQMTLKVRPKPEAAAMVFVSFPDAQQLADVLQGLNTSATRPMAIDVLNESASPSILEFDAMKGWTLAVGFEDNAASVAWQVERILAETAKSRDDALVFEGEGSFGYWGGLAAIGSAWNPQGLNFTASLPVSAAFPFALQLDPSRWKVHMHAGSGIVHGHPMADVPEELLFAEIVKLRSEAAKLGGSLILSRCPTDWKERLGVWGERRGDWAVMERIKQALDPAGVMNPGRFVVQFSFPPNPKTPAPSRTVLIMTTEAKVQDPGIDLGWLSEKIDYRRFQDCIHCGLCTASCPTYVETGDENDGPRGRIYLMRAVTDGRLPMSGEVRKHLDLCLDCRACESACPSGVKYGQLIEPFKVAMQASAGPADRTGWLQRLILGYLFPYAGRVRFALIPARILQKIGLLDFAEKIGATKLLPGTLRRMQAMLPTLKGGARLPEVLPAIGPKRARVALFLGCVADAMYPETNAATARVLQHNGCEVVVPRGQSCCGAIHYHSGVEGPALDFARKNMAMFLKDDIDAIITNAAGCGAMLKDYAHLLPAGEHEKAKAFVAKVRDISEFLVELGPIAPTHPLPMKVTYHDACHLCHGQQIRAQPRQLLQMIPGVRLIPLEETELCCGAAGTYNLTQPEMSERLGQRKMDHIQATGAEAVVTGNIGCILQIARKIKERGSPIAIAHPVELLDRAYSGD